MLCTHRFVYKHSCMCSVITHRDRVWHKIAALEGGGGRKTTCPPAGLPPRWCLRLLSRFSPGRHNGHNSMLCVCCSSQTHSAFVFVSHSDLIELGPLCQSDLQQSLHSPDFQERPYFQLLQTLTHLDQLQQLLIQVFTAVGQVQGQKLFPGKIMVYWQLIMIWYTSHSVFLDKHSVYRHPAIICSHADLQAASVLRQQVGEDRLGTPGYIRGVESCHPVLCQGNLTQQHSCEAVGVDDLVHGKLDLEVWAAWCQSFPWVTTHQLDREDEAETEMNKGNLRLSFLSSC